MDRGFLSSDHSECQIPDYIRQAASLVRARSSWRTGRVRYAKDLVLYKVYRRISECYCLRLHVCERLIMALFVSQKGQRAVADVLL